MVEFMLIPKDAKGSAACVILECERPGFFGRATDDLPHLIEEEGSGQGQSGEKGVEQHMTHKTRVLEKVYDHLVRGDAKYGIITCADVWWAVRRTSTNSLLVSQPISWSATVQPTVLATVSYVVYMATTDQDVPPSPFAAGDGADIPQVGEEQHLMRTRSGDRDVCEEHLHLARAPPIATGWSGFVNLGEVGGQHAAVKLAPRGTKRGQTLLAEAENYLKLQKLWGTVVPRMLASGSTCNGDVIFLATELLPGFELADGTRPTVSHMHVDASERTKICTHIGTLSLYI